MEGRDKVVGGVDEGGLGLGPEVEMSVGLELVESLDGGLQVLWEWRLASSLPERGYMSLPSTPSRGCGAITGGQVHGS